MNTLSQLFCLLLLELRLWTRSIRHAVISLLISMLFLAATNFVFIIHFDQDDRIGVRAPFRSMAREIAKEAWKEGLTVIIYDRAADALPDLRSGRIYAFVEIPRTNGFLIRVVYAGFNPLLDRELSTIVLRAAAHVVERNADVRIALENNRYTRDDATLFMVAGSIPFLILALASVNCGYFWLRDWVRGTMCAYLVTPVRRGVLLLARNTAGILMTLLMLAVAFGACRWIVTWPFPPRLLLWAGVLALQTFTGCGLFFLLATWAKHDLIYSDIQYGGVLVLMFVSGVFVPCETMPNWIQLCARMTPTFYAVRSMRGAMTTFQPLLLKDLLILFLWGVGAYVAGYVLLLQARMGRKT